MFGAAIVAKTSRMVATKITSSKAYPCCPAFRRANPRLAVIMANLQPAPREAPWRCVRRKLLQIPHWRSQFSECGSAAARLRLRLRRRPLSIAKKGEARSAVGHSAKTIELHTARQGQRRRGRGWRWKLGTWNFAFLVGTRDTRRRSLYRAKRIAAGTLVFRLAGTCDLIHANLRIVDAEHGVVVLDGGICNNCARLAVEIP